MRKKLWMTLTLPEAERFEEEERPLVLERAQRRALEQPRTRWALAIQFVWLPIGMAVGGGLLIVVNDTWRLDGRWWIAAFGWAGAFLGGWVGRYFFRRTLRAELRRHLRAELADRAIAELVRSAGTRA